MDAVGEDFWGISKETVDDSNVGLGTGIQTRVNNYVKKVAKEGTGEDAFISNKTTDTPVYKNEITHDGVVYQRIGFFTLEFEPELESIEVKGKTTDNTSEHVITGVKIRQSEEVIGVGKIESGKKFCLLIPKNLKVTEITNVNFKTEKTTPVSTIDAKIVILKTKSGNNQWQNLCFVKAEGQAAGDPVDDDYTWSGSVVIPQTGSLQIEKVTDDNAAIKMCGLGFKLYHVESAKWVIWNAGEVEYTTNKNAATDHYTLDENGALVNKMTTAAGAGKTGVITNLIPGTYMVEETVNPFPEFGDTTASQTVTVTGGSTTPAIIQKKNKHIKTKISGYVWNDGDYGKASFQGNNALDNGEGLSGITVALWYIDGNGTPHLRAQKTTDRNGYYYFDNVLVDELGSMYVDFYYNGLLYEPVSGNISTNGGSKGRENPSEHQGRAGIKSKFGNIAKGNGNTVNTNVGGNGYSLPYTVNTATHSTTTDLGSATIFARAGEWQYNGMFTGFTLLGKFNAIKATDPAVTGGIQYVNLGLKQRAQPDIAIVKDIHNVKLTINGYENVYKYENRFKNQSGQDIGENKFNVGVKFGNEYGTKKYTRAIYKSDYIWENPNDRSKELEAYITYKITIKNQSSVLTTKVNSIVDYYDKGYIEGNNPYATYTVGTQIDEEKGTINNILNRNDANCDNLAPEYRKLTIDPNDPSAKEEDKRIAPGGTKEVYVQFKLSRAQIAKIMSDKDEGEKSDEILNNVVEINSYSVWKDGQVYEGVDMDSVPGNTTLGNMNTYEDDTDAAPALQLEVAQKRKMAGTVFLDSTTGELKTGQIRQGNGIYNNGETTIGGVRVELHEKSGTGLVYYLGTNQYNNEADKERAKAASTTAGDGSFGISGFIPGDYELVYTWGNDTYTVQDYKATIYDKSRYQNNVNNTLWYAGKGISKNNTGTRYSDALDNYDTRYAIDLETSNKVAHDTSITKNKMVSKTPKMGISIEHPSNSSSIEEKLHTISDGNQLITKNYQIQNIDFGIVERARQEVELTKRVKTLKLTLANGQVISDVEFSYDKNGKLTAKGEKSHMTFMGTNTKGDTNRFIKLELDNEIIQGANLEVGYEILFYNKSEVDYANPEYYNFGNKGNNYTQGLVKITPNAIIDYLDKDWSFEESKNPDGGWEVKTVNELKDLVAQKVYSNTAENKTDINNRIILYTEKLAEIDVEPGKTNSVMLNVSKILTTTDDISLNNETDIVELSKNGGSKIPPTPGTYIPGTSVFTDMSDEAEEVIVTPSTGENLNYVLPITISLVALIILGAGVLLIKNKVLDNKE